jgi:hypothetical protein
MAGVSFWTLGCKPPISWMGGKSGYSRVIAELLGLSRLNPPAAYVWGDVGPNIAALACLFGAAGSAEEVARMVKTAVDDAFLRSERVREEELKTWREQVTYAAVCWRSLTYADVCCRMLPYAAVC